MSFVRRATANDVERIGVIARSAYAKYVPRSGVKPPPMRADFAAAVAASHVVVIETTATIDGYMIAWPETDAYFIANIAVDPARQGEGQGRRLIAHAVAEARLHGLSAIRLFTNAAMTENLSLYGHIGFVETHRSKEHGFHRVHMRWDLPEANE